MKKIALLISTFLFTSYAQAGPVSFSQLNLFVDAFAGLDLADSSMSNSAIIPPASLLDDLPLTASASEGGQSFADAIVDFNQGLFFVDAITESISFNGELSDAAAVSELQGEFSGAGDYVFFLDFDTESIIGNVLEDFADAALFAQIIIDGSPIFSESIASSGQLAHQFVLGDMSSALLAITLSSNALTSTPGTGAFNFASASFELRTLDIPEPDPITLFSAALLGFSVFRTKKHALATSE